MLDRSQGAGPHRGHGARVRDRDHAAGTAVRHGTRGRESNRLYVNAAHEPDSATAHGEVKDIEPVEVLQKAIASRGADIAAHEVRRQEQALSQHTRRRTTWWTSERRNAAEARYLGREV